jgi:hypothetical protein
LLPDAMYVLKPSVHSSRREQAASQVPPGSLWDLVPQG